MTAGFSRRRAGAVLIVSLGLALVLALIIGATMLFVGTHYRTVLAKTRSDAALLLAEGAVNDEITYISRRMHLADRSQRSSPPTLVTGGVKGRALQLPNTPGRAWVYSSMDKAGTQAWNGYASPFWITAEANVMGSKRRVRMLVGRGGSSRFFDFAVLATSPSQQRGAPSLDISRTARSDTGSPSMVNGVLGTNGLVLEANNSSFSFDFGVNGTSTIGTGTLVDGNGEGGPNAQGEIYNVSDFLDIPRVSTVLGDILGTQIGTSDPWTWLATNNSNNLIRTYRPSGGLTALGTMNAGITRSQYDLRTGNTNANSNPQVMRLATSTVSAPNNMSDGSFTSLPMSAQGRRALIFPPGDYYFTELDVRDLETAEIVIDGAGLTVGGNPQNRQVRFWIRSTGNNPTNDIIEMRVTHTSTDPEIFRLYTEKASEFVFRRPSNRTVSPSEDYPQYGALYQASQSREGSMVVDGGNGESKRITWYGTIYADRLTISDRFTVWHEAGDAVSAYDPFTNVTALGDYDASW